MFYFKLEKNMMKMIYFSPYLARCSGNTELPGQPLPKPLKPRECGHRQCPDLTGDWGLDDSLGHGGHGVPLLEALANTRCRKLLQQVV